jgi:hypothetical protein
MERIFNISRDLKEFFNKTADRLAICSGFIKRQRKLQGRSFVQALVMGNIGNADCSIEGMCQLLHEDSITISKQGLDYRFTESAVIFMKMVYEECLDLFRSKQEFDCGILKNFDNVKLLDSSNILLPDYMEELYKGHGSGYPHKGRSAKSSIKLQTLYNYSTQTPSRIDVVSGTRSDQGYREHLQEINSNDLLIADLGYFVPECFKILSDKGAYFISRYKADTNIYDLAGQQLDLLKILEKASSWQGDILLGKVARLPVRIVCHRLSKEQSQARRRKANLLAKSRKYNSSKRNQSLLDWSIFITNVPSSKIPLEHIATVYRTRWQIELLFKLYKSQIGIETLKGTNNSSRVLCELYAKLCGIVLFHAISNCLGTRLSNELSITKAFLEFKRRIRELLATLKKSANSLKLFLQHLLIAWSKFCLKDKYRKNKKSTLHSLKSLQYILT